MRLTITKCTHRINLIKFFRSEGKFLSEAIYCVDNLPFVYWSLSKNDAEEIQLKIKDCAICLLEEEKEDTDSCFYNSNIIPPQEYLEALAWYESCSNEHKQYIDQIVLWRNRPAVC